MAEIFTGAFWAEYGAILAEGVLDTLIMTAASTALSKKHCCIMVTTPKETPWRTATTMLAMNRKGAAFIITGRSFPKAPAIVLSFFVPFCLFIDTSSSAPHT